MPIHIGTDTTGKFFQWGKTGKKYYFDPDNESSRKRALGKAKKQQTAIYSAGWKGDEMKILKIANRVKKADDGDSDLNSAFSAVAKAKFGVIDASKRCNDAMILFGRAATFYSKNGEKETAEQVHGLSGQMYDCYKLAVKLKAKLDDIAATIVK